MKKPLAVWCTVLLCVSVRAIAAQAPAAEARLKAAVLSKFPQFVEWPNESLSGRRTLDVCVAEPDPFGRDIDDLLAGESLAGRALVARRVARNDISGCQVLYLPRSNAGAYPVLERTRTLPILTVSDDPAFLERGGMVALRMADGRVRFEINAAAARAAGLRISSQLLRLAQAVREDL